MERSKNDGSSSLSSLALIFIFFALAALLLLGYFSRDLILAVLIGVGLGVVISPLMKLLKERFGIPRILSAILVFVLVIGGIVGLGFALGNLLVDQLTNLAERAPEITETLKTRTLRIVENRSWLLNQIKELDFATMARTAFQRIFSGLGKGIVGISGALIVLLISVFVAVNSREYFRGLLSVFPAYQRPKAEKVLAQSAQAVRRWFRGQLIVMSITGTATTLGLWIIGIDYWLLFGVMTAVLGIIPYLGIILTLIAISLVTLGSDPEKIYWVLGLFFVLQQLEGNILIPVIMREAVELPEAHLIILMLFLASWFGILGAFVAPPLLAVMRTVYRLTYVEKMDRMTKPA